MDVLKDLLRIKIFREEKAERAVAKARLVLMEADESLHQARQALKEFKSESIRREKAMYADLCTRLVVLREIEDVRVDVDLMKEKAERLNEQVEAAELARTEAADRVEQTRIDHRDAVRMREKFDELLRTVIEERELDLSRQEELEMEEAASSRFAFKGKAAEVPDVSGDIR
jgi:type III secretion protein O